MGMKAVPDVLYENVGGGRFRDVSQGSGIAAAKPSYGLGVVMLDFDGDGRQDIFVGNDSMPSFLWVNQGQGRFAEQALVAGLALNGDGEPQATMGIAVGDVNGDGRPDVFTTNFANDTNTLRVSVPGQAAWEDRTRQYNLAAVSRPLSVLARASTDTETTGSADTGGSRSSGAVGALGVDCRGEGKKDEQRTDEGPMHLPLPEESR